MEIVVYHNDCLTKSGPSIYKCFKPIPHTLRKIKNKIGHTHKEL